MNPLINKLISKYRTMCKRLEICQAIVDSLAWRMAEKYYLILCDKHKIINDLLDGIKRDIHVCILAEHRKIDAISIPLFSKDIEQCYGQMTHWFHSLQKLQLMALQEAVVIHH